jgi:hypothetical protein
VGAATRVSAGTSWGDVGWQQLAAALRGQTGVTLDDELGSSGILHGCIVA